MLIYGIISYLLGLAIGFYCGYKWPRQTAKSDDEGDVMSRAEDTGATSGCWDGKDQP